MRCYRFDWCFGVYHHTKARTLGMNLVCEFFQTSIQLNVCRNYIPGLHIYLRADKLGFLTHKVNIERKFCYPMHRIRKIGSKGQIRYKVPIHYIYMEPIYPPSFCSKSLISCSKFIRSEHITDTEILLSISPLFFVFYIYFLTLRNYCKHKDMNFSRINRSCFNFLRHSYPFSDIICYLCFIEYINR